MTIALVGIDPGFAALGVARLELRPDGTGVVDGVDVIVTAKSARKREVLATEDNLRRCQDLGSELAHWVGNDVVALCCESQSWPRNATAAAKVAMSWGVIAELARVHGLPVLQASPQQVKLAVTGDRTASKADVQAALERRYPLVVGCWPRQRSLVEHAADALACIVACLWHPVVLGARRSARRSGADIRGRSPETCDGACYLGCAVEGRWSGCPMDGSVASVHSAL